MARISRGHHDDPAAARVVRGLVSPILGVFRTQAQGGAILVLSALAALFWANSEGADFYHHLLELPLAVVVGEHALRLPLEHWVNDGLMAIFFFAVGLEIKREVLSGELSDPRAAVLPIAGAVGGVVVPALVFSLINIGQPTAAGWGIPMATDIAFALGVLALLGARVPLWMMVFLTALAIVDDLLAVVVIAAFYTAEIHLTGLWLALGAWAFVLLMNARDVRAPALYLAAGATMWFGLHESGIHATIAGVLMGLSVPASPRIDRRHLVDEVEASLDAFRKREGKPLASPKQAAAALTAMAHATSAAEPPSHRIEHALHRPVAWLILPIFALANAGVAVGGETSVGAALTSPAGLGVLLGLLLGKPLGIFGASWLAVRLGLGQLPPGAKWSQLLGAAQLGGIGFTMSLFVTGLAFGEPGPVAQAKLGILVGSAIAAVIGLFLLGRSLPAADSDAAPPAGGH
ncbi:MAG: Na+/H+ antiporter NhaA [Deltaproteobacteria bacterium]|nr:Na+/H+ antiporter NhaA [Deltaproteobacteria bacterium]